jgi:hypothetical protein
MAIAYDAESVALKAPSGTGPLTFAHTCTGSDLILFCGCFATAGDVVTGITYNSVAMTLIGKVANGSEQAYLYYLINPTTGANNISVSWSGSTILRAHGVSYTGAKQSGVPDANSTATGTGTSLASSVTTVADNCWVIAMYRAAGDITAGSGTTLRGTSTTSNILDSNGAVTPAGSKTINANSSISGGMAAVIASFAPYVASSARRLALLGIGM